MHMRKLNKPIMWKTLEFFFGGGFKIKIWIKKVPALIFGVLFFWYTSDIQQINGILRPCEGICLR